VLGKAVHLCGRLHGSMVADFVFVAHCWPLETQCMHNASQGAMHAYDMCVVVDILVSDPGDYGAATCSCL
jgi:hypothetical protein